LVQRLLRLEQEVEGRVEALLDLTRFRLRVEQEAMVVSRQGEELVDLLAQALPEQQVPVVAVAAICSLQTT
jgi:hypothetical protein